MRSLRGYASTKAHAVRLYEASLHAGAQQHGGSPAERRHRVASRQSDRQQAWMHYKSRISFGFCEQAELGLGPDKAAPAQFQNIFRGQLDHPSSMCLHCLTQMNIRASIFFPFFLEAYRAPFPLLSSSPRPLIFLLFHFPNSYVPERNSLCVACAIQVPVLRHFG